MMLEQEFWEVFCVASRNIIMLFIAMVSCWIVVLTLLEKRRKVWPVVAYNIGKLIFSAGIVSLVLDHYYGETLWHKLLVLGLAMVTVVLDFTFYHYVFQCELLKLMIMVFISELFGAAVMEVSLLVLNLLEKSREVVALDIPISWMDLWIFPISAVLFSILYFPLRPLMLKFRNYRLSHRKIWATVFGIYFLGSFGSRFVDVWNSTDVYLFWYLFVLLGLVVVFTAGVLFLGKRGKVRAERDYLLLKQELLESHYTALQMQACRMETERALIGQQIREIASVQGTSEQDFSGGKLQISDYMDHLYREYDGLQAGIYCDDWVLDAFLFCEAKALKNIGVRLECSLSGYTSGMSEAEGLLQLLLRLFKMGVEQKIGGSDSTETGKIPEIRLAMRRLNEQSVITVTYTNLGKSTEGIGRIKRYVHKKDGAVKLEKTREGWEVLVSFRDGKNK